jgi:hypothetical protein
MKTITGLSLYRFFSFLIIISVSGVAHLYAQKDTLLSGKAFNFPFRKYGISIGNSSEFNGIRINYADKNVKKINGLNVTFWFKKVAEHREVSRRFQLAEAPNKSAIINGVTAGVIPVAGTMQPFNAGLLGLFANKSLNGLSIGGLFAMSDHINGMCVGGLGLVAPKSINGIAAGGFAVYSAEINGIPVCPVLVAATNSIRGLTVAGLYAGGDTESPEVEMDGLTIAGFFIKGKVINGVPVSLGLINCSNKLNGLAITAISIKSDILNGAALAGIVNTKTTNGLTIAIFSRTNDLHGVQIGLLNYAGNNRKGLKMLPVVNLNLRGRN